jgi:5-methylcytosine-specific restriction endonuclease McrA
LDAALLDGRLSWSKVVPLASIVMPHTQMDWIELAISRNCAQVKRYVARARQGHNPVAGAGTEDGDSGDHRAGLPKPTFRFQASYDSSAQETIEQVREAVMHELGKLATDDELFAWLLECGKEKARARAKKNMARAKASAPLGPTDPIPDSMRRAVLSRDGFACECCGAATDLQLHHIVFREHGGATTPENLLTTCAGCHGRIHAGWLIVNGQAPHEIEMSGKNGGPWKRAVSAAEPVLRILRRRCEPDAGVGQPTADKRRGQATADKRHGQPTADKPHGQPAADKRRGQAPALPHEEQSRSSVHPELARSQLAQPALAQRPLPQTLSLDDIPPVVDAEWWSRHEHLLEWRNGGLRVKAKARC